MTRLRPVIVVGAVEEEAATSRGARAVVDRWQPAFAIIGEPSGVDAVTLGYKGGLLVDFRVEASVAHTARTEESVCARGVAFWSALATDAVAWNAELEISRAFDTIAPSLRTITSGCDGFTDWCALTIGYRLPIGYDVTSLTGTIEAQARAAGGTVKFRGHEPAYRAERRGHLVAAFLRALRAEGMEPTFKVKTGTSDMNVVGPVWQCPILAYGPGDAALDHTPDEHIAIPEYLMSIAVLERTLSDLVTAPSPRRLSDDRQ